MNSKQEDLIAFVNDPENIKKAIKGSMAERNKVMTNQDKELRNKIIYTLDTRHTIPADTKDSEVYANKIIKLIKQYNLDLIDRIEKEVIDQRFINHSACSINGEVHSFDCKTDTRRREWQMSKIENLRSEISNSEDEIKGDVR